jgi:hypothetical protein
MINEFTTLGIMEPEHPQPLNPAPCPHSPFPYPTPHINMSAVSNFPLQ